MFMSSIDGWTDIVSTEQFNLMNLFFYSHLDKSMIINPNTKARASKELKKTAIVNIYISYRRHTGFTPVFGSVLFRNTITEGRDGTE